MNIVPIITSPENTAKISTILLLSDSQKHQGLGKLITHEELSTRNEKTNSEKMKLLSTILTSSTPMILKICDYHSEIELEYSFLIDDNTKSSDFLHFVSVIIQNQNNFFEDPEMVILGTNTSGEKPKVRLYKITFVS